MYRGGSELYVWRNSQKLTDSNLYADSWRQLKLLDVAEQAEGDISNVLRMLGCVLWGPTHYHVHLPHSLNLERQKLWVQNFPDIYSI